MADAAPARAEFDVPGALWTLVRTDLKVRYHGAVIGFCWAFLKPLAMLLVLWAVFSFLFGAAPDYVPRLLLGIFLYEYWQEATRTGLGSLHARGYLLTRSRFPRWVLVVSSVANPLVTLGVASAGLLGWLAVAGRFPGLLALALYLLYLGLYLAIVIGFSLAASVLFLRYRDLNQVWEVAVQAGFFAAPVFYPLDIIPERFHFWLYAWPPTAVMQFSRQVLLGGPPPSATAHLLLLGLAGACLGVGVLLHRWLVPDAAELL